MLVGALPSELVRYSKHQLRGAFGRVHLLKKSRTTGVKSKALSRHFRSVWLKTSDAS